MIARPLTKDQYSRLVHARGVLEVEDEAMDEGRFFVHLSEGFDWGVDPAQVIRTKSFGSYREAKKALANIKTV